PFCVHHAGSTRATLHRAHPAQGAGGDLIRPVPDVRLGVSLARGVGDFVWHFRHHLSQGGFAQWGEAPYNDLTFHCGAQRHPVSSASNIAITVRCCIQAQGNVSRLSRGRDALQNRPGGRMGEQVASALLFINYGNGDDDFALRLYDDLASYGQSVWIDRRDIQRGQDWSTAVNQALHKATHMLLIWSDQADTREVRAEWSHFLDAQKPIIILRRDNHPLH